jgi:hypothetical protein
VQVERRVWLSNALGQEGTVLAQKGFLNKTYSKKFEATYDKIRKLEQKGPYTIELLDGDNAAKVVDFIELPARIVVESLKQFMQPAN